MTIFTTTAEKLFTRFKDHRFYYTFFEANMKGYLKTTVDSRLKGPHLGKSSLSYSNILGAWSPPPRRFFLNNFLRNNGFNLKFCDFSQNLIDQTNQAFSLIVNIQFPWQQYFFDRYYWTNFQKKN